MFSSWTRHRLLWPSALLLALAFLAVDTTLRLRAIHDITEQSLSNRAAPLDAQSPSGYAHGQHRLILPVFGADGYHWILQTERMLAGDGLRIRETAYENPPQGREVHWSGSLRWWLTGVASVYRVFHGGLTLPQAVERVAPWAGTLALALFLLLGTPLLARRLGALAAAVFALGAVAIHPFYQYSIAGFLDHHGVAAMSCFVTIIALIAGGGGWVRRATSDAAADAELAHWLPEPKHARRWFMVSALAAAVGLWINAATIVPVLIGVGLGALAGNGLLARAAGTRAAAQPAPELWRLWGGVGAIASVCVYLLEYFPSHLGMRLEVNHPLYAIAWLAGGDLLARLCRMLSRTSHDVASRGRESGLIALDLVLIALLPAIILLRTDLFRVLDPFLWALHQDYILEFRTLGSQFSALRPWHVLQGTTSAIPLVLLPMCALSWQVTVPGRWRTLWRALLVGVMALALSYFHAQLFSPLAGLLRALGVLPSDTGTATLLVQLVLLIPDAAVFCLLVYWPLRTRLPPLPVPLQSLLALAMLPAALLLLLAFSQVRTLGVASVTLLAALLTLIAVLSLLRPALAWTKVRRCTAAALLGFVLLPYLTSTALFTWRQGYPTVLEETQLVARDIAYLLRARLGDRTGVVVSGPTTTTWLIYFGGLHGLGTLYWENVDGLKRAAAIYGARTSAEAKQWIDRHGVTHLVVLPWEPFVREYARLARGQRLDRRKPNLAPEDAFIFQLLRTDSLPAWLQRVPYAMPATGFLQGTEAWIFEVVPPATPP